MWFRRDKVNSRRFLVDHPLPWSLKEGVVDCQPGEIDRVPILSSYYYLNIRPTQLRWWQTLEVNLSLTT